MTKLTQYSEAFWSADYTSTAGYDALARHNSEEKKFLHDFEEYLRKRSKIELEYSKSLGQLAKSMKDRSAVGVLEQAWSTLRLHLDSCRQAHEDAGLFFNQHSEETKRFGREIVARRDVIEDKVKKIQNQKHSQFKSVNSLNKTYGQKCREKDHAEESYRVARGAVTSTVKELERAKAKQDKCGDEATKADYAYRQGVLTLEDTRQEWEKEMEQACKEFQESDEEQITYLRSEMWLAVNRVSQTAVDVDESCEHVRKVLETCDVDQEIQTFIANNATGTERPVSVPYQNYYTPDTTTNNSRGAPTSSLDNHQRAPLSASGVANNSSSDYYSVAHDVDNDPTYSTADPLYSSADPVPDPTPRILTVVKSYQTPEFAVQAGERLTLLRKVSPNLIQVRSQSNKTGNLPIGCIKESI